MEEKRVIRVKQTIQASRRPAPGEWPVKETLLVEHLSTETCADRYRYCRIVQSALEYPGHIEDHLGQIRRTVEAVRVQAGK